MTVQELIAALGEFDPNTEVHFTYNYGDHWRTTVAPGVTDVSLGRVVDSAYHNMPKVQDNDYNSDRKPEKGKSGIPV